MSLSPAGPRPLYTRHLFSYMLGMVMREGGRGGDVFFQVNNRLHCKAILNYMYVCIRAQGLYNCVGKTI
jgi:hypothetical protein